MVAIKKAQNKRRENYDEWVKQVKSISLLGADASKKRVRCIELNLVFESLSDAARWSESKKNPNGKKASVAHISRVCRGGRKTTGGYHWEYVN